jgi:predicted acylesterase/phospholipase RssA
MLPTRIYLSGGGICAMAHVGALLELSNHIPLKMIKEWMGVSAGSLVAMCICIGFTLEELYDFSVHFDFTNIKEVDSVPGWILHFGMDTGERLHRLIDACLHVKGLSSDFTFKECLDQFGISLKILATDLNTAEGKIFSPELTPNYKISNAVRASMSYPYYFQPFICPETGHHYIDGGVISNYPLFIIPKEEHPQTLSIQIRIPLQKNEDLSQLELDKLVIRPLFIALNEKTNIEITLYDVKCIKIQLEDVNVLDFSFNDEIKNKIVQNGKDAVKEYMKSIPKPQRRNSFS